jgi:hypothetical protein
MNIFISMILVFTCETTYLTCPSLLAMLKGAMAWYVVYRGKQGSMQPSLLAMLKGPNIARVG